MSPTGSDPTSAALERVMTRFAGMLRAVGRQRGLSEGDLDELAQETRLRLWRALGEGEKIAAVRTSYVYRAALSAAVDMVRRRRARREEPLEGTSASRGPAAGVVVLAGGTRPDQDLERRELGEQIDRAIDALPEARAVVVRLHLSGYGRTEIARLLGWTEPKVRNLIYRGLADLREALSQRGIRPAQRVH